MKTNVWIKIFLLFLLVIAIGCTSDAERWLDRAEACMDSDSDFAYRCLQQMETGRLTDGEKARYALLQVQAMHKCGIPLCNDSLINIAVAHYRSKDDRHHLAKALLYKGLVHKQLGEVENAVEAFAASERNFEGVEDNQYKALLFDQYAMLLARQAMYDEALHYFRLTKEYELKGDSAHYVVSTYRRIAMMHDVLGQKDSARSHYVEGLAYADVKGVRSRNYYLLLQNYASFLTENREFAEADRLLQECVEQMDDSLYIHTLYSSLATLYYEQKIYDQALSYAEKILDSADSLTVCGGYLRLYKIYRDMGDLETAVRYHDLYRQYENDLAQRRKTAQVAAIPYKVENRLLKAKNDVWQQRQWVWGISLFIMLLLSCGCIHAIRRRNKRRHRLDIRQLQRMEQTLAETKQRLGEAATYLGGLKGLVTNQSNALNRWKEKLQQVREGHKIEIERLKENMRALEADVRKLKEEARLQKRTKNELKQVLKELNTSLNQQTNRADMMEHQWEIDKQLNHFVITGLDSVAVDMLLQLRYGKEFAKYDIRTSEYLSLLKALLAHENPELHAVLEKSGLDWKKQAMCYLMALGLDDVEMMSRAACLAPNSVKAYRKECREMILQGER